MLFLPLLYKMVHCRIKTVHKTADLQTLLTTNIINRRSVSLITLEEPNITKSIRNPFKQLYTVK